MHSYSVAFMEAVRSVSVLLRLIFTLQEEKSVVSQVV